MFLVNSEYPFRGFVRTSLIAKDATPDSTNITVILNSITPNANGTGSFEFHTFPMLKRATKMRPYMIRENRRLHELPSLLEIVDKELSEAGIFLAAGAALSLNAVFTSIQGLNEEMRIFTE